MVPCPFLLSQGQPHHAWTPRVTNPVLMDQCKDVIPSVGAATLHLSGQNKSLAKGYLQRTTAEMDFQTLQRAHPVFLDCWTA